MSRYFPKQNDKTGWKRGAGTYSRSYLETTDKPPPGMAGHHPAATGPALRMGYQNRGSVARVQDLIKGTDISARVDRAAGVEVGVGEVGGYSGLVSRGHRPKHVAGKRSYKRV
jgi:hypothetical protein